MDPTSLEKHDSPPLLLLLYLPTPSKDNICHTNNNNKESEIKPYPNEACHYVKTILSGHTINLTM